MTLMDITGANLVGYAAILAMAFFVVVCAFAARDTRRHLVREQEALDEGLSRSLARRGAPQASGDWAAELKHLLTSRHSDHPTAQVLPQILNDPEAAENEFVLSSWIASAIDDYFASLSTHLNSLKSNAPVVGVTGTITGLLIATWFFGADQDQGRMMMMVSLALLTTLGAGIVTGIAKEAEIRQLAPARHRATLHAAVCAGRVLKRLQADQRSQICSAKPARQPGVPPQKEAGPRFLRGLRRRSRRD